MTKLTTSYAILALEALGYEEALNKKLSFSKVLSSLTIICRLDDTDRYTLGNFTAQLTLDGETYQAKLSSPVMVEGDITSIERALVAGLQDRVTISHDLARSEWESIDRRHVRATNLITIAADLIKK